MSPKLNLPLKSLSKSIALVNNAVRQLNKDMV